MAGEKSDSLASSAEERANSWILDYAYYSAWKEFVNTNKIDLLTTRDFVQWIVTQPFMSTTERKKKVQILLFLCRLSDGSDHTTRYSHNSDLTALEESLKSIHMIELLLRKTHTEAIKALEISVKKQAVLVCCRAGDFEAGKEVFQRQWSNATSEDENNVEEHLQTVLQSGDKEYKYIKFNSYERFLKKALQCLTGIHNTFSPPYLLQQAELFVIHHPIDGRKNFERKVLSLKSLESMNMKEMSPKALQNLESKLKKIREVKKRNTTESASTESTDTTDLEEEVVRKKRREREDHNIKVRTTRNTRNNNNHQQDTDSDDDSDVQPLRERIALDPNSSILQQRKRHGQRIPWNQRETEKFYEYVQKHGVGNWSVIKDNLKTFRTNVQLKDRWRWLVQNETVLEALKTKFGPV